MWRNPWERNKLIRELGYRWEWTNERPATGIRFGIECTDGTKDEACSIIASSTNDKPEDRILGAEKDYTHTACMTSHTNPIQKPSTKSKAWRVKELSYLDSCYFLTSLFFYIFLYHTSHRCDYLSQRISSWGSYLWTRRVHVINTRSLRYVRLETGLINEGNIERLQARLF